MLRPVSFYDTQLMQQEELRRCDLQPMRKTVADRMFAHSDIGRSEQSIVSSAVALWIDNSSDYRAYQLPAKTKF